MDLLFTWVQNTINPKSPYAGEALGDNITFLSDGVVLSEILMDIGPEFAKDLELIYMENYMEETHARNLTLVLGVVHSILSKMQQKTGNPVIQPPYNALDGKEFPVQ